jgi:hypothetical protein
MALFLEYVGIAAGPFQIAAAGSFLDCSRSAGAARIGAHAHVQYAWPARPDRPTAPTRQPAKPHGKHEPERNTRTWASRGHCGRQ